MPRSPASPAEPEGPPARAGDQVPAGAVALVKEYEGYHRLRPDGCAQAYLCPAGWWTVGWGTTRIDGRKVAPGDVVTPDQAEALLSADLARFAQAVDRAVTVPLNQNQRAALISWTYNVGIAALKRSTLLRRLNAGDAEGVPAEMRRWVKGTVNGARAPLPGLERRRAAEAALWVEPVPLARPPARPARRPMP